MLRPTGIAARPVGLALVHNPTPPHGAGLGAHFQDRWSVLLRRAPGFRRRGFTDGRHGRAAAMIAPTQGRRVLDRRRPLADHVRACRNGTQRSASSVRRDWHETGRPLARPLAPKENAPKQRRHESRSDVRHDSREINEVEFFRRLPRV